MPRLIVQDLTVGEGDRYVDVVVRLDAPATSKVTVDYATAEWTAYDGGGYDYLPLGGKLSFDAGETHKTVRLELRYPNQASSDAGEPLERFKFVLSNPSNATLAGEGYAWITIVDNDNLRDTPELWVGDVVVDEKAGEARFVVTLGRVWGQSSLSTVTVDYTTVDGSARAGEDYGASSGKLTFLPGESTKTVVVPVVDDALAEGAEAFGLRLSNPGSAEIVRGTAWAGIGASDAPPVAQPRLSVTDMAVGEGDYFVDVVVSLSAPATSKVTVDYATAEWTAYDGGGYDYLPLGGKLSFDAGETSKTVRLELRYPNQASSDAGEPLERFKFVLSNPSNATLAGEGYAWITIVDNDNLRDTPELWVGDVVVDEKAGEARFVVTLGRVWGQSSLSTVTVDYTTVDGSARAGEDYGASSGKLTFLPGESTKTVVVPVVDDALAEGAEAFGLRLSNPGSAEIVRGTAWAGIGASDAPPVAQPRLSVTDMAVGEGDYFVDVVVSLSAPATSKVTVDYATAEWTAYDGGGYDYLPLGGKLSFDAGETSKTVRLELRYPNQTSSDAGEPLERFKFVLSNPSNATLAGEGYAWITIVDNDNLRDTPELWVGDVVVDEKAGEARFVVTLGRVWGQSSLSTVTVDYATRDGAAKAGLDYAATSGTLTFLPGESAKTVVVPLHDDALTEGLEQFSLVLSNPQSATIADGQGRGLIGASDARAASQPTVSAWSTMLSEDAGPALLIVQLDAPSMQTVSVQYATRNKQAGSHDFVALGGRLTFLPGETTKTVQVDIKPDSTVEGSEAFDFVLSAPSNARLSPELAQVLIADAKVGSTLIRGLGLGDDVYEVSAADDIFLELPVIGGRDTVRAFVDGYTLPADIENWVSGHLSVGNATGNAGHNLFVGTPASNRFDGGAGIDTVVFAGPASAFQIGGTPASRTVAGQGSDTLLSIERLQFSDRIAAFDTLPGGQVHGAAALFNAGFNRLPSAAELSLWAGELSHLGGNLTQLAQQMINHYAPGVDDATLVAHLWSTVVGTPLLPADAATYQGLLQSGAYTQATLLEAAALHPLNLVELVGFEGSTQWLDPALFPPVPA